MSTEERRTGHTDRQTQLLLSLSLGTIDKVSMFIELANLSLITYKTRRRRILLAGHSMTNSENEAIILVFVEPIQGESRGDH